MSYQPSNPSIPKQDVGPPWYRPPKLCERCWSMFEPGSCIDIGSADPSKHPLACGCRTHEEGNARKNRELWRVHHASGESLLQAVRSGCEFCVELTKKGSRTDSNSHTRLKLSSEAATMTCFSIKRSLEHSMAYIHIENAHLRLWIILWKSESSLEQGLPIHSLEESWTGSAACTALAKYWLNDCMQNHPSCFKPPKKQWYPTRLLKISGSFVYLIDCSKTRPTGPYATLSHCWGKQPFEVLTSDTLSIFQSGILIEKFLPSFRDALITTRELGIFYIWIDCFCIVQDTMDWDFESGRMMEVYSNGILNLAATHAADPKGGLFSNRNPVDIQQRQVIWRPTKEKSKENIFFINLPEEGFDGNNDEEGPLWLRAWVVQERLLSPRLLYFEHSQISWRCSTIKCLKETFPTKSSLSPVIPNYGDRKLCGLAAGSWTKFSVKARRIEALNIWDDVVRCYTLAHLTHPKDKISAIKGIGDLLAEIKNDVYIDGFFVGEMPRALCWYFTSHHENDFKARVEHTGRAPTWSWISWDGEIDSGVKHVGVITMLVACVSNFHAEFGLPLTLYCIGKLLPLRRRLIDALSNTIDAYGVAQVENSGTFMMDSGRRLNCNVVCLPVYAEVPREGYRTKWDGAHVTGIILEQLRDGTFRRLGRYKVYLSNQLSHYFSTASPREFLDLYNRTRPRLIALV